ncbi:hypothetical protein HMPREF1344_01910 [Enterococcus faecalis R508]|jgi:hypothetical protein|nr:hypothetical protein HMPREF1344_01910 [Enterococcus faecalis R508]
MRAKLFLILRNRVLSRVVFVIIFLHVFFTTNDFTVLLLLLLLNYLLTLEDSAKKTEKSKLGRNLNSRLIGPLSLFIQGLLF